MEKKTVSAGDINSDGVVDVFDLFIVSKAYGSVLGEPDYNPEADINKDGVVDTQDLNVVYIQYGEDPQARAYFVMIE